MMMTAAVTACTRHEAPILYHVLIMMIRGRSVRVREGNAAQERQHYMLDRQTCGMRSNEIIELGITCE
jgi:hypothetical protein